MSRERQFTLEEAQDAFVAEAAVVSALKDWLASRWQGFGGDQDLLEVIKTVSDGLESATVEQFAHAEDFYG